MQRRCRYQNSVSYTQAKPSKLAYDICLVHPALEIAHPKRGRSPLARINIVQVALLARFGELRMVQVELRLSKAKPIVRIFMTRQAREVVVAVGIVASGSSLAVAHSRRV